MKYVDIAGWENLYRSGERGAEDQPTRLLIDVAAGLKPGSALDLACGTGRNALFLAGLGWKVTALDGSETAIRILRQRSAQRGLPVRAEVADLTSPEFSLPIAAYDLIVIAYYLQRDLFQKITPALRDHGLVLAIVHIPDPGEPPTGKRAAPGELRSIFNGWELLHDYEGPSRDPAHRRPVAEIVARRIVSPERLRP
ncbi:MAG TPA: methyltransferase domain-containing protein [Bryobacteraceae bacterium]|jgi:SAM-dependent methyltransferase|nr:methyltransferase domain-containing protein [Bryobacteraceae bacterium]